MQHLINSADVLINLHRAEGYGLVIAEALLSGVPALYTSWSSPQEFNNILGAYPIDYDLEKISDGQRIYKNGIWAKPDLEQASAVLRQIYDSWTEKSKIDALQNG